MNDLTKKQKHIENLLIPAWKICSTGPPYTAITKVDDYELEISCSSFGDSFYTIIYEGELMGSWDVSFPDIHDGILREMKLSAQEAIELLERAKDWRLKEI